eukprot:CAMPEP_0113306616 /NCGR_PEP_ID=MMETSP0010_2-20120614/5797_1 /TAXON_ID=216773 ORGANISM="Corethron hystrix, Strain 308" /NCGR_SAMPLE_ID=MMETSP0010_2 /ASSEMBLY_ACC=CAM_ASM_000155 /LENGTH=527 /DNA_ID=CAMNT_0000161321 /DNA_START=135 /DNA_END=1718 /DNA_ORIENTATION=- /assembly_acc=CAM_ASM_000155
MSSPYHDEIIDSDGESSVQVLSESHGPSSSTAVAGTAGPSSSGGTADDGAVCSFLGITGSEDVERASSYLEMAGGDLSAAVGLYMEHNQGGGSGSNGRMDGDRGIGGAIDASTVMGGGPLDYIAGAPVSRSSRVPTSSRDVFDEDGIRVADISRHDRLVGFSDHFENPSIPGILSHTSAMENSTWSPSAMPSESLQTNSEIEADRHRDLTLSEMFAPPLHLMHQAGGFQGARSVAKDTRRWLLVNVQCDSDFSCHALNRDVWKDELVGSLVQEGFVFWQQLNSTTEGQTYLQRYNIQSFPHVGIIDPRTGRLMWSREGWTQEDPMTALQFAGIATDFCSAHSFDKPPAPPRQAAGGVSGTTGPPDARKSKRPINELSEEEQLQAAIQASMAENNEESGGDDMDEDEEEYDNNMPNGDDGMAVVDEKPDTLTMADEFADVAVGVEPATGARVQIRMPDGRRVVRRFDMTQNLKVLYAFVIQSNDDAKSGKPFILKAGFPLKDLACEIDGTFESCGLNGGAVTMAWKID